CRSYSETAKRLYCSQPTISYHIQQLEEHFHTQLFHRSGKSVQLTNHGELLLQYAKQISSLWEEATLSVKNNTQQEHTLPLFVSEYIAEHFFTKLSTSVYTSFPKQDLESNSYCYDDLKDHLQTGKITFALTPIYPKDDYIRRNC